MRLHVFCLLWIPLACQATTSIHLDSSGHRHHAIAAFAVLPNGDLTRQDDDIEELIRAPLQVEQPLMRNDQWKASPKQAATALAQIDLLAETANPDTASPDHLGPYVRVEGSGPSNIAPDIRDQSAASCEVPMWNSRTSLCEEDHKEDTSAGQANGTRRKMAYSDDKCTFVCPHMWMQVSMKAKQIVCNHGAWKTPSGGQVKKISCKMAQWVYLVCAALLLVATASCCLVNWIRGRSTSSGQEIASTTPAAATLDVSESDREDITMAAAMTRIATSGMVPGQSRGGRRRASWIATSELRRASVEAVARDSRESTDAPVIPRASIFLPLRLFWGGYTPEELAHRSQLIRVDCIVVPIFGVWYLIQALIVHSPDAPETLATWRVGQRMSHEEIARTFIRLLLAVAATYVLVVQSIFFPAATADQDGFNVQKAMGKWIYLTRHCVCMQAWHQSFSFAALFYPKFELLTHGMTIWVASLGWFVTVQYFLLVLPNEDFQDECQLWARRGVQFKEVGDVLHMPALPISVLDIILAKSCIGMKAAISIPRTLILIVVYVVFYLSLITVNRKITGSWPYEFMREFGSDVRKWTQFILTQVMVLLTFVVMNLAFYFWKTRWSLS